MAGMNVGDIREMASRLGLDVECSSPGDGATRYTLGHRDGAPHYGFHEIMHSVCGSREAYLVLRGYEAGLAVKKRK